MICPYCRAELGSLEVVACEGCGTAVHAECASAHGACVTYGCASTEFASAASTAPGRRLRPTWPVATRVRAFVNERRRLAWTPTDDAALAALAGLGMAGLVVHLLS